MAWKRKYAAGTTQIAMRLPTDTLAAVDKIAKRRRVCRTDVIVSAIAKEVKSAPAMVEPDADAFT